MIIRTLAFAGLALLCACQRPPIVWHKPGATGQSFAADKLECVQTAYGTIGGTVTVGAPLMVAAMQAGIQSQRQEVFNTCMQAKGWIEQTSATGGLY